MSEKSIDLIEKYFDSTKFLLVVRDPVQRTISSYAHMRNKVGSPDGRSLAAIVDYVYKNRHKGIIEAENEHITKNIKKKKIDDCYMGKDYLNRRHAAYSIDAKFQEHLLNFKYIQHSMYSYWIKKINLVSKNVKITSLEKIANDENEISDIMEFLNLRQPNNLSLHKSNVTKRPVGWLYYAKKMTRSLRNNLIGRRLLNSKIAETIKSRLKKYAKYNTRSDFLRHIDRPTLLKLRSLFESEYDKWKSLYPNIYDSWKGDNSNRTLV
jgi:hypothetical protein